MPIIDLEFVLAEGETLAAELPVKLADALGQVFEAAPGRVWVRVRTLPAALYAENETALTPDEMPVFINVLLAQPPEGGARVRQAAAVCAAVAQVAGRAGDRVHLIYEPAAKGRIAFGGKLAG